MLEHVLRPWVPSLVPQEKVKKTKKGEGRERWREGKRKKDIKILL